MRRQFAFFARSTLALVAVTAAASSFAATQLRAEWFNNRCPLGMPQTEAEAPVKFAGLVGAIAAVIVPKLVSGGVDLAAKKLQAAGSDRPNEMSARTDDYFYTYQRKRKNTLKSNCLIVVEAENFDGQLAGLGATDWRRYATRVGTYQGVRMIFMAAVETAPEGKLFRLVPAYLEIKDWRERSFWNSDRRDYNIAVTLSVIGQTSHFASLSMNFKGLTSNKTWTLVSNELVMGDATTDYVPLAPISEEGTKFVASVESAWATKDHAASILDEYQKWLEDEAKKKAGTAEMPMPNLYRDAYLSLLDNYCASVRTANKDQEKSKREIPSACNFRLDQKFEAVAAAKKAVERAQDWRDWAAVTCWPDKTDRATALSAQDPNGAVCAEPKLPKRLPQSHTRVAGLVVVTEVIPGSKAAKFLGDALAASSADVSKVIVDKLPPLSQQARDAAAATDRTLAQAVVDADYKVEIAENELAELPSDAPASKVTAARMKRQAAWYAANNAYRAVGRNPPYPDGSP